MNETSPFIVRLAPLHGLTGIPMAFPAGTTYEQTVAAAKVHAEQDGHPVTVERVGIVRDAVLATAHPDGRVVEG